MTPQQDQELIDILARIANALELSYDIQGAIGGIANSLLQLSDKHGSGVPGPY